MQKIVFLAHIDIDYLKNRWYNYLIMKKKSVWVKQRHNNVMQLVRKPLWYYLKKNYGLTYEPFDTQGKPYLILANHQTGMDQFICELPLKDYAYPIASEDIFSTSTGKLISWLVAPIPLIKGQKNIRTILTCKQVAEQNKSILLFPEGNRTYSGKTEYISIAVAKLAKMLKLPIAFCVIRGGYGVKPRWADKTRKGSCHVSVERVMQPEEYADTSEEELYQQIRKNLFVDESKDDGQLFKSKKLAEYLERAIFYCPKCGISHFESKGNLLKCTKCGLQVIYQPNKQFVTPNGNPPPYRNVNEWYEAQRDFVCNFTPTEIEKEITQDKIKKISEVFLMKGKKTLAKNVQLVLYPNRIKIIAKGKRSEQDFDQQITSVTVLGKNKLNIYFDKRTIQLVGGKRFNALKYANFYYRYKNFKEGNNDKCQFLGL